MIIFVTFTLFLLAVMATTQYNTVDETIEAEWNEDAYLHGA
jgi:hypothetical protein